MHNHQHPSSSKALLCQGQSSLSRDITKAVPAHSRITFRKGRKEKRRQEYNIMRVSKVGQSCIKISHQVDLLQVRVDVKAGQMLLHHVTVLSPPNELHQLTHPTRGLERIQNKGHHLQHQVLLAVDSHGSLKVGHLQPEEHLRILLSCHQPDLSVGLVVLVNGRELEIEIQQVEDVRFHFNNVLGGVDVVAQQQSVFHLQFLDLTVFGSDQDARQPQCLQPCFLDASVFQICPQQTQAQEDAVGRHIEPPECGQHPVHKLGYHLGSHVSLRHTTPPALLHLGSFSVEVDEGIFEVIEVLCVGECAVGAL